MSERTAPVQGYSAGIPWSLHLRAWDAYAAKWGRYQSAERMAERGGFHWRELDEFLPGWRDEASEIGRLRAVLTEISRVGTEMGGAVCQALACGALNGGDAWAKSVDEQEAQK